MGFLSKITRAVSKAAKPAQRLVKAAKKVRGTASTAAGMATGAKQGTMPAEGMPPEGMPPDAMETSKDAVKRRQTMMQTAAQGKAVQNKSAVQMAAEEGNVPPHNPMGAMLDPAVAQAAEADRKRKLGVRSARGVLRRTILG